MIVFFPDEFLEDVTQDAIWEVSSAKAGTGVADLIDNREDTFWQSNHHTPHTITAQFNRKRRITRVDILLNVALDDSYTPKIICVRVGTSKEALTTISKFTLTNPIGWQYLSLNPMRYVLSILCDRGSPVFRQCPRLPESGRENHSASSINTSGSLEDSPLTTPPSRLFNVDLEAQMDHSNVIEEPLSNQLPTWHAHTRTFRETGTAASPNHFSLSNACQSEVSGKDSLIEIMASRWINLCQKVKNEVRLKNDSGSYANLAKFYVPTFVVQIVILQNFQNGQDSHVRQVRILSAKC